MAKKLVLAGAGHAHMTLLARLGEIIAKGVEVTVVGPSERHYYSGMGPGMLGGSYTPRQISFPVKDMVEKAGGRFVIGHVQGFDPRQKTIELESGEKFPYDVVSFNTGSRIPDQMVAPGEDHVYRVKPIENLLAGRERILELAKQREVSVGVVGGGPGALEVGGNAWAAGRQNGGKGARVTVYGGIKFLRKVPPGVEKISRGVFAKRGIDIREGAYVDRVSGGEIKLRSGESARHDVIFVASGVKPRPIFESSGVPVGDDGGLKVNRYLQSVAYPEVLGGGDCVWFEPRPLDKVGVFAVRQNPVLLANVQALLEGGDLTAFEPGGEYLLIFNLGGGQGIFVKWGIVFGGKLAFKIKDYIDRKFIMAFKADEND